MQVLYFIGYVCVMAMALPTVLLGGETVGWLTLSNLSRDVLAHIFAYGMLFAFLDGMLFAITPSR